MSSSTIVRRFGGWKEALEKVGAAHLYSGRTVSPRMKEQLAKSMSDDELAAELRRVAQLLGTDILIRAAFDAHARVSSSAIETRFGSWAKGLATAGLSLSSKGRRHTDEGYFENLLRVWVHYGRQPKYAEMDKPPSQITSGAYEHKWGTWGRALQAFLDRVNSESPVPTDASSAKQPQRTVQVRHRFRPHRGISLGLRYDVLRRDKFKCVLCGATPATQPACTLHVDHTVPLAAGGTNDLNNLRTLCERCNVGKGVKSETTRAV